MVKITNGTVTTEVTQGAYDTFYKEQGFVTVSYTHLTLPTYSCCKRQRFYFCV